MVDSITWKIGGEAGFGIMASGTMLARTFTRAGYWAFTVNEYPSLIRGGHNVVTVRIATEQFHALTREVHILIALNKETIDQHVQELQEGSVIVYDNAFEGVLERKDLAHFTLCGVPFSDIITTHGGNPVMRNTVALGATVALLGADFELLEHVINDQFKEKKPEIAKQNCQIAREGFDYIVSSHGKHTSFMLSRPKGKEQYALLNASEAVGLGALTAGLAFAAIYPMTPINALIPFLSQYKNRYGVTYKQPEDEISGINMAIGASIAGARSMVATSGGGFALMEEGLAFAGIAEVPLVIDLGMRVGPASGMPTWSEQGELRFAIHAGHGEFLRVVLAPGDGLEAYTLTKQAFELADKYQIPVFILTDKYINESQFCIQTSDLTIPHAINRGKLLQSPIPDGHSYKRYDLKTSDGVSPRTVPGVAGGIFMANSYEHDEYGFSTEDPKVRISMVDKRAKKRMAITADIMPPRLYGEPDADITFVGWGSVKGPVCEALQLLNAKGQKANFIHYTWLYPFPSEASVKLLGSAKRVIDIENNSTAQLSSLITEHTGIFIKEKILKYDGRPFYPEEIVEAITKDSGSVEA